MFILTIVIHLLTFLLASLVIVLASCYWLHYASRREHSDGTPASREAAAGSVPKEHLTARRHLRFPDRPSLDDILAGTAPNQHVEPLFPVRSRSASNKKKENVSSHSSGDPVLSSGKPSQPDGSSSQEVPPIPASEVTRSLDGDTSQPVSASMISSGSVSYASPPAWDERRLTAFPTEFTDTVPDGSSFWEVRSESCPKRNMDATDRSILADDDLWEGALNRAWMYERSTDHTYWLAIKFTGINLHHKQVTSDEYARHHSNPEADRWFVYSYYSQEIMKILNGPPQLDYAYILDGKWKMNVFHPLPFESARHLKAHINYLFRTDRIGKYTTELTPQCNMAFFGKTDQVYSMGTQKNRKLAGNILYRDLMEGFGQGVDHLAMQLVEISVDDEMMELSDADRLRLFTDYISRRERVNDGWQVMAYVEHSDLSQDRVYHIHTVLRRIVAA